MPGEIRQATGWVKSLAVTPQQRVLHCRGGVYPVFFFVFDELSIEFIGESIYGGVHVLAYVVSK